MTQVAELERQLHGVMAPGVDESGLRFKGIAPELLDRDTMGEPGVVEVCLPDVPALHRLGRGDLVGPQQLNAEISHRLGRKGEAVIETSLVRKRDFPFLKNAVGRITDQELGFPAGVENAPVLLDPADDPLEVNLLAGSVERAVRKEEDSAFVGNLGTPLRIDGKAPHRDRGNAAIKVDDHAVLTEGSAEVALFRGARKEGDS